MATNLTPQQQAYLNGLRSGDPIASGLIIHPELTARSRQNFINFESFLKAHGHPNPQPEDLYITIAREAFLDLLNYANDRGCLILQNCFGFDQPPVIDEIERPTPPLPPGSPPVRILRQVGRAVLLNKGNFQQSRAVTDDDFFDLSKDTVFRNEAGNEEFFLNITQPVPVAQARGYLKNFRDMYTHSGHTLGYLLPVKAMINFFGALDSDTLTFRWGITNGSLGNFALVIGIGDMSTGPTVEFWKDNLQESNMRFTPCPPNPGCN